jgi:hypothetical protein
VGLLLVALGTVRNRARQTSTETAMNGFSQSCMTFQAEHSSYPGVIPEDLLAASPGKITSTENMILHMAGGYRVLSPTSGPQATEEFDSFAGFVLSFGSGAEQWRLKVDPARIGEGPMIDNKPFAPYYVPSERHTAAAKGQYRVQAGFEDAPGDLPDLVDSWGQPIISMRRVRSVGSTIIGPQTLPGGARPQFLLAGLEGYLESDGLGELEQDQVTQSILNMGIAGSSPDGTRYQLFRMLLQHPAIEGQPRGEFMLLSAGADGIYMSCTDGPGSHEDPISTSNLEDRVLDKGPTILEDFDDIRIYGGG